MRIDEDAIFGAYMDSLIVEKKKGLPPWLKKKGDKKEEDEDDSKKSDKKKKKGLPPWLKGKKKKVIKEDMSNLLPDDMPSDVEDEDISLIDFMDELKGKDPELYQRLEDYMKENEISDVDSGFKDTIEGDIGDETADDSTSKYL